VYSQKKKLGSVNLGKKMVKCKGPFPQSIYVKISIHIIPPELQYKNAEAFHLAKIILHMKLLFQK
jgi:hypothetical protein